VYFREFQKLTLPELRGINVKQPTLSMVIASAIAGAKQMTVGIIAALAISSSPVGIIS